MIHVTLTEEQRRELDRRLRQQSPAPVPPLRLEMIRLAAEDWRIPRIARHLGCHEPTVRKWVKAFRQEGFAGLVDRPRPGAPRRLTEEHLSARETLIDGTDRTWTTPQRVAWLEQQHQVRVHPDYWSQVLHRRRFAWKRTQRSVAHKRKDPDRSAATVAELELLKNRLNKA